MERGQVVSPAEMMVPASEITAITIETMSTIIRKHKWKQRYGRTRRLQKKKQLKSTRECLSSALIALTV